MKNPSLRRLLLTSGVLLLFAVSLKHILPFAMPFLVGALVAMTAEPLVRFSQSRLKLSRGWSAGLGVTMTLLFLAAVLSVLGAFFLKEMVRLAGSLPDLENTAKEGVSLLGNWLSDLTYRAPNGLQPVLIRAVDSMRYAGTTIADRVVAQIPSVLSGFLSGVPDGALRFGTGLLASFMISARLPKLKSLVQKHVPQSFKDNYLPALLRTRKALGGWLKAQGILSSVTYGIVSLGLLILRVPYGFFWALFVTLVDAVPMLGTGIILLPWAMIRLLQSQPGQAVGLLLIFGAASLCRATLEPKLVGKQLGLDPLLTLVALYCGYRIWGFWGLLGAPVLTAAIKSFLYAPGQDS